MLPTDVPVRNVDVEIRFGAAERERERAVGLKAKNHGVMNQRQRGKPDCGRLPAHGVAPGDHVPKV